MLPRELLVAFVDLVREENSLRLAVRTERDRLRCRALTPEPSEDAGKPLSHLGQRVPTQSELLDGDRLLHTDFNPLNILIADEGAWIIDWAWPTSGARFIDQACFAVRLIASGQTPHDAEQWAARCDGWTGADPRAIDLFVTINARMFREIAGTDPTPWKNALAIAVSAWDRHRAACAPR